MGDLEEAARHGYGGRPRAPARGDAVVGSFFATLKVELLYRTTWPTRAAARSAISHYIEAWSNSRCRHSTLGYLSPTAFKKVQQRAAVA